MSEPDVDAAIARFTRPVIIDHLIQAEKDARILAAEVIRLRALVTATEAQTLREFGNFIVAPKEIGLDQYTLNQVRMEANHRAALASGEKAP